MVAKSNTVVIGVLAVVLLGMATPMGLVAAQTETETTTPTPTSTPTSSYTVTFNATDAGNASTLDVSVDDTSQGHDLVADGEFSTTLETGATVSVDYVDDTDSVTATATYTVGDGGDTLSVSDATVTVDETEASTGGGGTSDGDGDLLSHWLVRAIIGAAVAGLVFKITGFGEVVDDD